MRRTTKQSGNLLHLKIVEHVIEKKRIFHKNENIRTDSFDITIKVYKTAHNNIKKMIRNEILFKNTHTCYRKEKGSFDAMLKIKNIEA